MSGKEARKIYDSGTHMHWASFRNTMFGLPTGLVDGLSLRDSSVFFTLLQRNQSYLKYVFMLREAIIGRWSSFIICGKDATEIFVKTICLLDVIIDKFIISSVFNYCYVSEGRDCVVYIAEKATCHHIIDDPCRYFAPSSDYYRVTVDKQQIWKSFIHSTNGSTVIHIKQS